MQIEYKIRFEDGGVTITQTVEPTHVRGSGGHAGNARPGRQLASTLVETQHLDRLAGGPNDPPGGVGGGPNDPPGGVGGGPNDPPGGVGGGPNDPAGGVGGGPNDPPGGVGGGPNNPAGGRGRGTTVTRHIQAAGESGKVSAVILGPLVIRGF